MEHYAADEQEKNDDMSSMRR